MFTFFLTRPNAAERDFVEEVDDDSPFYDSDADPEFLPAPEKRPRLIRFNNSSLLSDILTQNDINVNESTDLLVDSDIFSGNFVTEFEKDDCNNNVGPCEADVPLLATNDYKFFVRDLLIEIVYKAVDQSTQQFKKDKRIRNEDEKIQRNRQKHPLLSPCKATCRKNCRTKISENVRQNVHNFFWKMNFSQRRLFLESYVKQEKTRQTTTENSKEQALLNSICPKSVPYPVRRIPLFASLRF